MPEKYDSNALWVAISEFGEGNLFNVYPKLLAEILLKEDAARVDGDTSEAEKLVLPSDREWRIQKYFMLVSMQKVESDEPEEPSNAEKPPPEEHVEEWAPWNVVVHTQTPRAPPPVAVRTTPGPAWDLAQVLKAARLLFKPPMHVEFSDEQEMRCVYSVIYDVYRYKSILDQAIFDVSFFNCYPKYRHFRQIVWLFLMELARRRWAARARGEIEAVMIQLSEAGFPFKEVENAVWDQRVHFAAAVARIRIKNKAFELSELLPPHLRDERVLACVHKQTVTGWVNTFKAKKIAALVKRLHELGYSYSNSRQLCAGEYRFDRVCPRFITIRPSTESSIGQLDLVKDGVIVLQEREFCEGASTLCRALRVNELRGVVAQTHASSPRSSAYLAAQLRELAAVLKSKSPSGPTIPELGKLVVFGAGDKVESYVESLRHLGIEASVATESDEAPVCVYSESVYCDTPTVISALDEVVAVLCTPPNSYSAVSNPIDLVCGRGGDLALLEILTEAEIDSKGRARVQSILEEQKKTLKTLLSKPQIQLILYETHSALEAENQAQLTRAVAEANRLARERHALLRKKHREHHPASAKAKEMKEAVEVVPAETPVPKEVEPIESVSSFDNTISRSDFAGDDFDDSFLGQSGYEGPASPVKKIRPFSGEDKETVLRKLPTIGKETAPGTTAARPIPEPQAKGNDYPRDPDKDSPDVNVPNCDLFEIGILPTLGNGLDINYILDRDGCYLGLIQRKEITRLDAKYMIRVAEERGLFGGAVPAAAPRRKRHEAAAATPRRRRRKTSGFEIERVAAPTYASIVRSARRGSAPAALEPPADPCHKHARRQAAASAIAHATCICDARHRRGVRRGSLPGGGGGGGGGGAAAEARGPPACRRPFPLVVHDVQLLALPPAARKVVI